MSQNKFIDPARDVLIEPTDFTKSNTVPVAVAADGKPAIVRFFKAMTSGDIKVTTVNGTDRVIQVAAGVPEFVLVTHIWDTGTTASDIHAYL